MALVVAAAPARADGLGHAGDAGGPPVPPGLTDRAPSLPAGATEVAATTIAAARGYEPALDTIWLQLDARHGVGGFEPLAGILMSSSVSTDRGPELDDIHAGVRVPVTHLTSIRVLGWWRWLPRPASRRACPWPAWWFCLS